MPSQMIRNEQRRRDVEMMYDADEWAAFTPERRAAISRRDTRFGRLSFIAAQCGCKFDTYDPNMTGTALEIAVAIDPVSFADTIARQRT